MGQNKTGNILSFDFGEKRIGVAIGNITTQISHPLHTIETEKNSERFKIIEGLLNEWKPDKAIVGLPLNDDGSESKLTQLAKKFTNKIKNKYNLEVINVDERFSSKEAKQRIIEDGLSRKDKGRIDQVAASIILESYFEQKKMKLPDPEKLIEKLYLEIEKTLDNDSRLIGIPAGGHLIINKIIKKFGLNVPYGCIDGSFYRDDLDISGVKLKEKTTNINFDVENKKIILIDDVFYTGRTTRAAINEIFDYGRPKEIKLYVLIDRNQNELPFKPSFAAYEASQLENSYINLEESNGKLEFRVIEHG